MYYLTNILTVYFIMYPNVDVCYKKNKFIQEMTKMSDFSIFFRKVCANHKFA